MFELLLRIALLLLAAGVAISLFFFFLPVLVVIVDELADRVIDRLTMQVHQQEAAYGLV